ncbi:hypothetical protein BLNAU_16017 [Blattamonas nauphoetae]|uniref:Uncharacterized protein n=1 Tax=Blattamonas nauphoetae TaxID=2049346 RepID=A0ABQ9XED6_9EUKA|nr:hypothetical protein BLNAU_16017 [Blattamonas nauphoetae]
MILFCLISSFLHAQHTTITIAVDGMDNLDCLIGIQPCKTIDYAMQHQHFLPDFEILVSDGTFLVQNSLFINETENFHFSGAHDLSVLKSIGNGEHATFSIADGDNINIENFAVFSDYNSIAVAQGTSNLVFRDITFSNYEFKGTFFSPYVLHSVKSATIYLEHSPNIRIPEECLEISYYISATSCVSVAVNPSTAADSTLFSSDCGLGSFLSCDRVEVNRITISRNSGNMIYADGCGSVICNNLIVSSPMTTFNTSDLERQTRISHRLQDAAVSSPFATPENSLPLIQFETAIVSVRSSSSLEVKNGAFTGVWGGCIKTSDLSNLYILSTSFNENTAYLSPSLFSPKDAADKEDLWAGFGCGIHAENVLHVQIIGVISIGNAAEKKFEPMSVRNGQTSFTQMRTLSSDVVSSNIFLKNMGDVEITNCKFVDDRFVCTSDIDDEGTIVKPYFNIAPTIVNLGHVAGMRAYADIFISRAEYVHMKTINAEMIQGPLLAIDQPKKVTINEMACTKMYPSGPIFNESSIWIRGSDKLDLDISLDNFLVSQVLLTSRSIDSAAKNSETMQSNDNTFSDIYNDIHTQASGAAVCISRASKVTLKASSFTQCWSRGNGGAVSLTKVKAVDVLATNFTNCHSHRSGGALFLHLVVSPSASKLRDVRVLNSRGFENGGAMAVLIDAETAGTGKSDLTFEGVNLFDCIATEGGGIWLCSVGEDKQAEGVVANVAFIELSIDDCHALFGGGLFSQTSARCPVSLVSSEVTHCGSEMGGAAVMLAVDVSQKPAETALIVETNTFDDNRADGAGSALLVSLQSSKAEVGDNQYVSIANNNISASVANGHEFGLTSGAITIAANFAPNSIKPSQVSVTENVISGTEGAGITAIGIGASIAKNQFALNTRTVRDIVVPIHIECSFSKLSVAEGQWNNNMAQLAHTYDGKDKAQKPFYHCDQACIQFEDTKVKCDATQKKKGQFSKSYLDATNYPLLPAFSVKVAATIPSNPLILVSTSATSVPRNFTNDDPCEQYVSARAESTKHDEDEYVEELVLNVEAGTKLVSFPEKQPTKLFLFASADGMTWSEPMTVKFQSKGQRIAFFGGLIGGVVGGVAILAVVAVIIIVCVCRRRNQRTRYSKLSDLGTDESAFKTHATNYSG